MKIKKDVNMSIPFFVIRHFGPVTNLTKFMLNIPTIAPLTGQSKHLTMP